MRLEDILFTQGFGTRRECRALIRGAEVEFDGQFVLNPDEQIDPIGKRFAVSGKEWPYFERALIAMNKPAMYECSQKPSFHPSVMSLLPGPLRTRGVQPVGRLDVDATGLLLFTDDGALLHRLTHPKKHVEKTYEVQCNRLIAPQQIQRLLDGVLLQGGKVPCKALRCEALGERKLRLTITSGKYHQVKRMIAAVGNHVDGLHRLSIGSYSLPEGLEPGQWVWLADAQALLAKQEG